MTRSDDDLIRALAQRFGAEVVVRGVRRTLLPGGAVSKCVERIDLTLGGAGGDSFEASFVRKTCPAREARALEALAAIEGAVARPELIASRISHDQPDDLDASEIVTPFYPGATLRFGDPIPAAVLVTLARLHAATSSTETNAWAPGFGAARVEWLVERAARALAVSERFKATEPDHAAWLGRLQSAGAEPRLREAAEALPRALTHGDMHPANIVLDAEGAPIILDWGNVAAAPPTLDLANIIDIDGLDWRLYLDACAAAGGQVDEGAARCGYWWARAATALGYIPWAAESSAHAPRLIAQVEDANARLAAIWT
jgi:aminoglycoside phosphotransferase (APT) family kinase protein